VLSKDIPLGLPSNNSRIEAGVPASKWYAAKHGRNGPGRGQFWPLHLTAPAPWDKGKRGTSDE
jgi:hypothetical protein